MPSKHYVVASPFLANTRVDRSHCDTEAQCYNHRARENIPASSSAMSVPRRHAKKETVKLSYSS